MTQTELCKYGQEPKSCTSNPMDCQCAIDASLAQTQEPVPPPWWTAVENILNEYGLQAIDFVADFKQALAQKQEPVAWLSTDSIGERHLCFDKPLDNDPVQPLYTHPPQRTWVGLNDEDICTFSMWLDDKSDVAVFTAIEAKLKEKNNGV